MQELGRLVIDPGTVVLREIPVHRVAEEVMESKEEEEVDHKCPEEKQVVLHLVPQQEKSNKAKSVRHPVQSVMSPKTVLFMQLGFFYINRDKRFFFQRRNKTKNNT